MDSFEEGMQVQDAIAERIADFVETDPDSTAASLMLLALRILAKAHPPELTEEDRTKILDNYPPATDNLIADRAIGKSGVEVAILTAITTAKIASDYRPLTHTQPYMDQDFALPEEVMRDAQKSLSDVFEKVSAAGVSDYGAAAMMILTAVMRARAKGLTGLQLIRPLLDAISFSFRPTAEPQSDKQFDERLISRLAEAMGISRTAAKKYVQEFKGRDLAEMLRTGRS